MIIPVRCFTCGKVIGSYYEKYKELLEEGLPPDEALDKLGLERYCCRRMIIAHVELIDEVIKYE